MCQVSSQAVSKWRNDGIPPARLMYLRLACKDVFEAWEARQRAAEAAEETPKEQPMPEPKVAAGTPTEDAQQRVGVPAVSPESAHSQPDEREGDAPALIQIGPTDI